MPERIRVVRPPRGFSRLLYRLPILSYKVGLGGFLGGRFLLLQHRGRKSGLLREAVIEIIRQDRERDRTFVAAAWGERSDWYRNLLAHPQVRICVGRDWKSVNARTLSKEEGRSELKAYSDRHPTAARNLAKLMGYRIEGQEDFAELAAFILVVVFEPLTLS